jgi:hypothetical protein
MSDVEKYWEAIRKKWNKPTKPWSELTFEQQHFVIQSINMLILVLEQQ